MSPQEMKQLKLNRIYKALLSLLADHSLSDISVSVLCRNAGVSRTYYYRNYKSMQEIISRHQEMAIKSYLRILPHAAHMNFTQLMTAYFRLMKQQSTENVLLINAGLTDTLIRTFRTVYLFLVDQKIIDSSNTRSHHQYFPSFMAGAVISIQIQWIQEGMKETPAEMGKILNELFSFAAQK
ncbi:TetR/AcrR family transcriptional regulator [Liquorilactobacillus mali]|uniref:Transcription regulator n=1 Tax=Liquorilactobacillus mali TaxID=1618 RepID=A0A0R2FNU9_9LACO|nr:TetR-like C-terminal domain-containing protein [Liquorilactobacillus mali]KRN28037.1 transcription regulator [Liquorilactobacillus mali]